MAASYVIDFVVGWSVGQPQAVIRKQKEKSEGENELARNRLKLLISLRKRPLWQDLVKLVAHNSLAQPLGEMRVNEFVILQVRIEFAHAIYLFRLAGRQVFVRVKTPAPFK